jgi:hypothetical protein
MCDSGPNRAMRFFAAILAVTNTIATPQSSSVIFFTVGGSSNRVTTASSASADRRYEALAKGKSEREAATPTDPWSFSARIRVEAGSGS